MSATLIPPEVLARRRAERERQRREREAFRGSILETLANDTEQRVCVAHKRKEPTQ